MDYDKIIIDLLNRIVTLEDKVAKLENGSSSSAMSTESGAGSRKYRSLSAYLDGSNQARVKLSFDEIQEILNRDLPDSAFSHRAFWANTTSHAIALSWMSVNYSVVEANLKDKYIVFAKDRSVKTTIDDQMRIIVAELISEFGAGHRISKRALYDLLGARFQTKSASIIPSDYCYDRVNKGIDFQKRPRLLSYVEEGVYECLGENYPFSGPVYARKKGTQEDVVVGVWEKGVFEKNVHWEDSCLK